MFAFTDELDFAVEHFFGEAGVGAEEDRGVHDGVGSGECVGDVACRGRALHIKSLNSGTVNAVSPCEGL
jgi:hypothetical protein